MQAAPAVRYRAKVLRVELVAEAGPPTGDILQQPGEVRAMLRAFVATLEPDAEYSIGVYVTARNRMISLRVCYKGTLDRCTVEPREFLRDALLQGAAGLIIAHNHPSGDPTPSREDREWTRRLALAAEAIGIRFLDHFVVGSESVVSFREAGLL